MEVNEKCVVIRTISMNMPTITKAKSTPMSIFMMQIISTRTNAAINLAISMVFKMVKFLSFFKNMNTFKHPAFFQTQQSIHNIMQPLLHKTRL